MTNTSSSNWKLLAHSLELLLINSTITWTPITNTFNSIMSPFDSKTIPNISIHSYLERINKHAKCSDPCFVVAYIYINRVLKNKGFILSRQNIYRLILASMVVAIKYNDDVFASNKSYSMIGGVDLDEINILEPCILDLLQFHLFVTQDLYLKSLKKLRFNYKLCQKEEMMRSDLKPLSNKMSIESIETLGSFNDTFKE